MLLGTRTKQINSYGKRNRRVVDATPDADRSTANSKLISIFDDLPPAPVWTSVASKMKKRDIITKQKPLSHKVVGLMKKRRLSPILSPVKMKSTARVAQIISAEPCEPAVPADHGLKKTGHMLIYDSPPRAPLSAFRLNMPGSPAVSQKLLAKSRFASKKGMPSKLTKPFLPFVDMDIMVLDDEGRTVRKERKVPQAGVGANSARQLPSKDVQAVESGDLEPDTVSQPRRPKRNVARKQVILVSDDSESEEENSPLELAIRQHIDAQMGSQITDLSLQMSKATLHSIVEVVVPAASYRIDRQEIASSLTLPSPPPKVPKQRSPSRQSLAISLQKSPITLDSVVEATVPPERHRQRVVTSPMIQPSSSLSQRNMPHFAQPPALTRYPLVPSPILKTRQLTPIRGGRNKRLFDPPSPPSPTTPADFDFSMDFSDFSLESPSQTQGLYRSEFEVPKYLNPLLEECHQETCGPHNFSAFIESFPFDPIISRGGNEDIDVRFRKIGEASYSEVFGIGDVVLKVIPLRDESEAGESFAPEEEDGPAPTDAKDVRKEIIVTRAMGEVYNGFVKLLKTYVVRGRYPEVLLQLWDEYNERKGSESVRPGRGDFLRFFFANKAYACCQIHSRCRKFMRSSSSQMVVLTSKLMLSITRVEQVGGKQAVSFGKWPKHSPTLNSLSPLK